jgi:hypothetical protein
LYDVVRTGSRSRLNINLISGLMASGGWSGGQRRSGHRARLATVPLAQHHCSVDKEMALLVLVWSVAADGERENLMHRCTILALGLALLTLAGCGDNDLPPIVQVSGGEAAQTLGYQLGTLQNQVTTLQNQVSTLQRRVDMLETRLPR